jgi:hypothetical protein
LAPIAWENSPGEYSVLDLRPPHRVHAKTAIAVLTKGEKTMQGLKGAIVAATLVAASIALGGCFGHHEKAVVAEPLKLGSAADTVVELVVRV